jgi:hypothetical protein
MGRLDLPDKTRDEDTAAQRPRPEIGSENWVRAEVSAGRSGEEHDQ